MNFTITEGARTTVGVTREDALALGYTQAAVGAAMKAQASDLVTQFADTYRAKIASAAPGKIAEWLFKEQIARDPDAARAEELAIIDREAAARGLDRAGMLALIISKANAFRETALLVGAIETEAKAAVEAVPTDADDIETQLTTALAAAKTEAAAAFSTAMAQIAG